MTLNRIMLKSKIHRARIAGTQLEYEGNITIDKVLLGAADMLPGEQVHVVNLNNGSRMITYIIEAPANSGTTLLNSPGARIGQAGDQAIMLSYCGVSDEDAPSHKPLVVLLDDDSTLSKSN